MDPVYRMADNSPYNRIRETLECKWLWVYVSKCRTYTELHGTIYDEENRADKHDYYDQ